MGIPNSRLNSTDGTQTIANAVQKGEIQAAKQHPVVRKASEQIDSPRSRQNVPSNHGWSEGSERINFFRGKGSFGIMSERIGGLFCESSRWLIHSHHITMNIEREGRASPRIGSDQTLNVDGGVGGACLAITRRDKASRRVAEWIEGVGRG
jgi:hypothetical protein